MTVKYLRAVALILLCGCALTFGAGRADAHDVLVSTQPVAGSSVQSGPSEVRLVFDKPVEFGFTDVEVFGPGGTSWAVGPATVYGDSVSAPVLPLGPRGDYTIRYRIVSADGHPVSGQVGFTLAVAGTGKPAPGPVGGRMVTAPAQAVASAADPENLDWLWLAGAAAVAIALGLFVAGWSARRRS